MPARVIASRSSCCVAAAVLDACGALDGHRGRRGQHDDHLLRQHLARAAVADHDVPRAQRRIQRVGCSVDGERSDTCERCRQRENERAHAQAAAARHDPVRVHDPRGGFPPFLPGQGAARVGVEREVLRGPERGRREGGRGDHGRVVDAECRRQQAEARRRARRRPRPAPPAAQPLAATPPTTASSLRPVASSAPTARSTSCRTIAAW